MKGARKEQTQKHASTTKTILLTMCDLAYLFPDNRIEPDDIAIRDARFGDVAWRWPSGDRGNGATNIPII
jgi:hypothetical protein